MVKLYPSLMAANQLYLGDAIKSLEADCAGFHCDIMDNHFVPNLTFGAKTVNSIDAATALPSWIHLMVDNPLEWCKVLQLKPNSLVSFHIESECNPAEMIKRIRENNWKPSVAINPKTNVDKIFELLNIVDQVLIMSVEPGFSGQPFLRSMLDKVAPLIAERKKNNFSFTIGMDGGVNFENLKIIADAGVDECVVGAGIFNHPDPVKALQTLVKLES